MSGKSDTPRLQSQLDDLALFPDRQDRIDALIEIGRGFKNLSQDELARSLESRVPGCESEVYVGAEVSPEGGIHFRFAVDNPQGISAMALAQILKEGLNGLPPAAIASVSEDIVTQIFGRELSMGKSLGLTGMVRAVKYLAARA